MLLHHHFVRVAKKYGDKPFFIDCSADKTTTYSKALTASIILAEKFRRNEKGFTGIMIPTSAGCALSVLAVLMSGRTPVMINYSTGAARNAQYAQERCNFRTIITSRALLEKIDCRFVDGMIFIEDIFAGVSVTDKLKAALMTKLPVHFILRNVHGGQEDDNLTILFTSGSERDPKAVQLSHRNLASNIKNFSKVVDLSDKDVMLASLPYFHVFGLTVNLWTPIYHGMSIVSYANPMDYKTVSSIIRERKPSMIVGTPSFLQGYLRKSEPGDFSSIRLAVCGADKCPDALRAAFFDKHGIILCEGYGTTETSPVISVNTPAQNKPGSVGKILPGVQVRIENYDSGDDCAPGETGRIMVKGDLVMKGYFSDIEETSMRVRHGWYDTGDMGFLDEDGYLWHAGRLKRFVKIGGEMISLVKVEHVLEGLLPEDISCCVVAVPDPSKGAEIIAALTRAIDEKRVLKLMSEHLPNIALPKQFVVIEELPKMGSGKTDFRGVTEMVRKALNKEP